LLCSFPEEGSGIRRSSTLRHACKGATGTEIFFRFRQVPFHTGTEFWVLRAPNPRVCKSFPLNTAFLCVQIPSRTGLTVSPYIGCTMTLTALLPYLTL